MSINLNELIKKLDEIEKAATLAAYKRLTGFYLFSLKNKKLQPNTKVRYLIFNLPALDTCPFSTAFCRAACYAVKAENAYPNTKVQRRRNLELTVERELFRRLAIKEIHLRLNTKSFQKAERVYFRIHESGDFYSADYAADWIAIAAAFGSVEKIAFAFYTKSFDYFLNVTLPENMVPTASVWADTAIDELEKAVRLLGWHIYSADTAERIAARKANGEQIHVCRCADCATCAYCYSKRNNGKRTECVIH